MTGLQANRVTEVIVTRPDGPSVRGTGYLVTGSVVLTAAHLVTGAASILVRCNADQKKPRLEDSEWSTPAAVGWIDVTTDSALLTVESGRDFPPTRYGRIPPVNKQLECSTVGYPRFELKDDNHTDARAVPTQYRDMVHRFGRIASLSHLREGTLELQLAVPERDQDPDRSPWEGMSGAPVFVGDLLVGVVVRHVSGAGRGVLSAMRIEAWYGDTDQLTAVRQFIDLPGELPAAASDPVRSAPANEVVLSYHEERDDAEIVSDELTPRGIHTVLQRRRPMPGVPVRQAIARTLTHVETVALLIGPSGLGPWPPAELRAAFDESVRSAPNLRLITVLLPGAGEHPAPLPDGQVVDLRHYLRDPDAIAGLVAVITGLAPAQARGVRLPDHPAPYPSLRAFTQEDAGNFFGRSDDIRKLHDRVLRHPFTAVFGASGSGKSSLVMAGLLPLMEHDWNIAVMVPGERPLEALAELGVDESGDVATLLVIDQFEEVFTQTAAPQVDFIDRICHLYRTCPHVRTIITLRADFFELCLDHAELRQLLPANQVLLGALDDASLREAIVLPAQLVGAILERGLVERILADMRGRSGALPLLQTALAELWQRRRGAWLTHDDYDQIQGIGGALDQLAQRLYDELTPHQQELVRTLFLGLVSIGDNSTYTRRRARRAEFDLVAADGAEIDRLFRALSSPSVRLISIDRDTVELTHEALIDGWETLRKWLRHYEADVRTHRSLTEDARRWEDDQRDDSYLYHGVRLATARDWAQRHGAEVSRHEAAFLDASNAREAFAAQEAVDRTVGRAGQALLQLESTPEEALRMVMQAATEAMDHPVVQRVMFKIHDVARIERILRGHADRISSVAWHPSGDMVATGSYDSTVRLWDVETSTCIGVLEGHTGSVTCVAFDRAGARLASGSFDQTMRIWDVASRRSVRIFEGHEEMVSSVAWSPSERYIATGSQDNTGRIWDVSSGAAHLVLTGHRGWVRSVEWHPSEQRILTGSYDGTAGVWNVRDGMRSDTLEGHDGPVPAVVWTEDGSEALTASEDGTIQLWNMTDVTAIRRIRVHTSPTFCVALVPGGRLAATGGEDGIVRIFDVDTGMLSFVLPGHAGWVSSVAWSPDGSRVLSGGVDKTARVSAHNRGFVGALVGHNGSSVSSLSWHPSGVRFVTAGYGAGTQIWDLEAEVVRQLDDADTITAAWSPDGRYVACGAWAGRISIWDASTWTVVHEEHIGGDAEQAAEGSYRISSIAWAPTGGAFAVASFAGTVRIVEVGTWQEVDRVTFKNWVEGVAWNPTGERLLVAAWVADAYVWDLTATSDDTFLIALAGHKPSVHTASWSADGATMLTTGGDSTARLWRADTGEQLAVLPAGEARSAAINPEYSQVITGSRDGGLRLWDVSTGADLLVTFEHYTSVLAVAWHPDGTCVLAGTESGEIRLWPTSASAVFDAVSQRVADLR